MSFPEWIMLSQISKYLPRGQQRVKQPWSLQPKPDKIFIGFSIARRCQAGVKQHLGNFAITNPCWRVTSIFKPVAAVWQLKTSETPKPVKPVGRWQYVGGWGAGSPETPLPPQLRCPPSGWCSQTHLFLSWPGQGLRQLQVLDWTNSLLQVHK